MSKNKSLITDAYYPTSGELPVCMTNDLLFHLLLQDPDDSEILKGIISSFYEIPFDDITSAIVENPVSYGETIKSKEMVLDIKALLNDDSIINLEMQVMNYMNWTERSISYLCRCFDNLNKGQGYLDVKGAYHIGFLDYTLFPDEPDFFATYSIRNNKTYSLYTSKFGLSVVDLSRISMATDDDKIYHRDLWASFFKAKSWEEIHMLAKQDNNIRSAAIKLHQISEDQKIRDEIWAREDYIRCQIDRDNYYKMQFAKQESTINEKDAELERLRSLLIKNGIDPN